MPLLRAALSWNFVLATAICASLLAQLIKVLLNLFIFHRFIAERMWGAGGMPSSHSATVCAMVVATGRYCGVNSPLFAIAAVLSIIVMYDAMGVRYETGEQAKVLNRMFTEWMDQGFEQFRQKAEGNGRPYADRSCDRCGARHCAGLCHADGVKTRCVYELSLAGAHQCARRNKKSARVRYARPV